MTFEQAINGCKVGEFVKAGHPIPQEVVHVGANDGYEIDFYLAMGVDRVRAYEPDNNAYHRLYIKYKEDERVRTYNCGVGNEIGYKFLKTFADDQKSSFLAAEDDYQDLSLNETYTGPQGISIIDLKSIDTKSPAALVIDVQGYELHVLAGLSDAIRQYSYAVIEVSKEPQWIGGPYGQSILDYMSVWGFKQLKPEWWHIYNGDIPSHDDMLFIRGGM